MFVTKLHSMNIRTFYSQFESQFLLFKRLCKGGRLLIQINPYLFNTRQINIKVKLNFNNKRIFYLGGATMLSYLKFNLVGLNFNNKIYSQPRGSSLFILPL